MKEHKIEGEKAYPIYMVCINYSKDVNEENREYAETYSEIKDGRVTAVKLWNHYMHEEEKNPKEIENIERNEHWPAFIKSRERGHVRKERSPIDNPILESITVELSHYETWSNGWFMHWTFDDGRTDAEYLASFARFVWRMEGRDDYCLMGAGDRWRWRGGTDDEEGETSPPCRCKHCKAKGIVRIDH